MASVTVFEQRTDLGNMELSECDLVVLLETTPYYLMKCSSQNNIILGRMRNKDSLKERELQKGIGWELF